MDVKLVAALHWDVASHQHNRRESRRTEVNAYGHGGYH